MDICQLNAINIKKILHIDEKIVVSSQNDVTKNDIPNLALKFIFYSYRILLETKKPVTPEIICIIVSPRPLNKSTAKVIYSKLNLFYV